MDAPIFAEFLAGIVRSSWQEAVLAAVVWILLRALGDRVDARWRCRLWFLVLLRLAWPFFLPSPVSLFNWSEAVISVDTAGEAGVEDPSHPLPFVLEQGPIQWVWLAVAGILLLRWVGSAWNARRLRRDSVEMESPQVLGLLEECRMAARVGGPVRLLESGRVTGPCLVGLLEPAVVMPAGLVDDLTDEQLRFIFRHELAHLRRWDLPLNWLLAAEEAFHWFNPLVWWVAWQIRWDREEVCDQVAVEGRAEACRPYGQLIVQMALRCIPGLDQQSSGGVSLLGVWNSQMGGLRRRLRALGRLRRGGRPSWTGPCLWVGVVLAGFTDALPLETEEEHRPGQVRLEQIVPTQLRAQQQKTPEANLRGL